MKHAYLLHTGYGKTKMCLDKIINAPRKPRTLLISTKNIVQSAWPAEIDKWYPGKISYAYITGEVKEEQRYEILNQSNDILGINTAMIDWYISHSTSVKSKTYLKHGIKLNYNLDELINRFDLIIIDEVSLFKNSQSERFKLIKKWCYKVQNVIILSATPTPKDIEDIWAPIYLIDGGERLGKTITKFREDYAIAIPMLNGQNRYQYSIEATNEVLRLIKDISTSIPAPVTPLFPEPIIKKIIIKPDPVTLDLLKRFKEDYIVKLHDGSELVAMSIMQMINKTNQIANGNVYNQNTTVHLNDLKFQALKIMLSKITTPVLLPYTFVFDKNTLLQLPGARVLEQPQDFIDWNANLIPYGIISPSSAAHGLNLQDSACENIIWYSPIWDTEKWIQLNARVCRRGQKRVVTISVLLLKESYDEYAFETCLEKFKVQYNNLLKLQ